PPGRRRAPGAAAVDRDYLVAGRCAAFDRREPKAPVRRPARDEEDRQRLPRSGRGEALVEETRAIRGGRVGHSQRSETGWPMWFGVDRVGTVGPSTRRGR